MPKTVSLRYNPGGVFQMSNGIMDNPGDAKYGMTTEQLMDGFRKLKDITPTDVLFVNNRFNEELEDMKAKLLCELDKLLI